MSAHKTIPLEAVRSALMCAVIKQKTAGREVHGKPHGRVAAYSYYAPLTSVCCRNARRGQVLRHFPGLNFGVLSHGDLDKVLERVRWSGLHEVRATWGAGVRALKAEFADGVMR